MALRWIVRAFLVALLAAPIVGAVQPIAGLNAATTTRDLLPVEYHLLGRAALLAFASAFIATAFCAALAPVFQSRAGVRRLRLLALILTATFFVPTSLKAYAFSALWRPLEIEAGFSPWALYAIWLVSFQTVFGWAAILSVLDAPRNRATIDSLAELTSPLRRAGFVLRLCSAPLLLSALAVFTTVFFGGIELTQILPNANTVGQIINGMLGGRDQAVAIITIACAVVQTGVVALLYLATRRFWSSGQGVSWGPA